MKIAVTPKTKKYSVVITKACKGGLKGEKIQRMKRFKISLIPFGM